MSPQTFSRNQHLRLALLLPVCLGFGALAACTQTQQAPEQPENTTKPEVVKIQIKAVNETDPASKYKIRIVGASGNDQAAKRPRRVCYDKNDKDAFCEQNIEYEWKKPHNKYPGVELSIEYKDGVYWDDTTPPALQTVRPDECFTGFDTTGGKASLTLTRDEPKAKITLIDDAPCGLEKVFFFYDVKCKETQSGACGNIEDLDPGTLLDNGRR